MPMHEGPSRLGNGLQYVVGKQPAPTPQLHDGNQAAWRGRDQRSYKRQKELIPLSLFDDTRRYSRHCWPTNRKARSGSVSLGFALSSEDEGSGVNGGTSGLVVPASGIQALSTARIACTI